MHHSVIQTAKHHEYVLWLFLNRFSPNTRLWLGSIVIILPALVICLGLIGTRIYVATHGFTFEIFWPPYVGVAFPIPFAYLLWLATWDRGGKEPGEFSITAAAISAVLAILAFESVTLPDLKDYRSHLAILATTSSLFIFTGYQKPWESLRPEPGAAILATVFASTVWLHTFLHTKLWQVLCEVTAWVIAALMKLMTIDVTLSYVLAMPVTPKPDQHPMPETEAVINMNTEHFGVLLYSGCSGMDGLMLFFALMTIVTFLDWERFKKLPLLRIYVAGLLTMFLVNALRITFLFLIGNAASHPNAPEWFRPMKNTMFTMFHDHVGWTVYAIVFAIFITPIYHMAWQQEDVSKLK